jgi:hypothetical protein
MSTSEEALFALRKRKFRPLQLPKMMAFTYGYDGPFMDVVLLRGEFDASAFRSWVDESDYKFAPFSPKNVVWALDGNFGDVVGELLGLPSPGESRVPSLIISTPSSLWIPPICGGSDVRSVLEI